MFYIYVEYFYLSGTLFAPQDGPLLLDGKKKTFTTKMEARDYLRSVGIDSHYKGNQYCPGGRYVLRHGEYDRPTYKIRRVRK